MSQKQIEADIADSQELHQILLTNSGNPLTDADCDYLLTSVFDTGIILGTVIPYQEK